jgi:hypothetical protein
LVVVYALGRELAADIVMRTQYTFAALLVALLLTPVVLFGALLLVPVGLLLLATLPVVGVGTLLTLLAGAQVTERRGNRLQAPVPHAGIYSI